MSKSTKTMADIGALEVSLTPCGNYTLGGNVSTMSITVTSGDGGSGSPSSFKQAAQAADGLTTTASKKKVKMTPRRFLWLLWNVGFSLLVTVGPTVGAFLVVSDSDATVFWVGVGLLVVGALFALAVVTKECVRRGGPGHWLKMIQSFELADDDGRFAVSVSASDKVEGKENGLERTSSSRGGSKNRSGRSPSRKSDSPLVSEDGDNSKVLRALSNEVC